MLSSNTFTHIHSLMTRQEHEGGSTGSLEELGIEPTSLRSPNDPLYLLSHHIHVIMFSLLLTACQRPQKQTPEFLQHRRHH